MNDIKKLLHRIRLVSDADAPELVAQLLLRLNEEVSAIDPDDFILVKANFIRGTLPCWDQLQNSISLILSEEMTCHEVVIKSLHELYDIAMNRAKYLKEMSSIIQQGAEPYLYKYSNANPNRFGSILRDIVERAELTIVIPQQMTEQEVFESIKELSTELHRLRSKHDTPMVIPHKDELLLELDAFEAVVKQYFARKSKVLDHFIKTPVFCETFMYCEKCWRLVPVNQFGDGYQALCDVHTYEGGYTDYKKGNAVQKKLMEPGGLISLKETEIFRQLKSVWRVKTHEDVTWEEWEQAFETETALIDLLERNPRAVEYDLEPVWEMCPFTHDYILKAGGDPMSPASVLAVLDPFTQYEIEHGDCESREQLHKALALNFSFYRVEIARAEACLSQEAELYAGKTHGGARSNSGGKRPGAGRPKKNP